MIEALEVGQGGVIERAARRHDVAEIGDRQRDAGEPQLGVAHLHGHDALGIDDAGRPKRKLVPSRRRRHRTDGEGQCGKRGEREERSLEKRAGGKA
jgi:hypothetical protein